MQLSPDLAEALDEMKEEEFVRWQHTPVGRIFFAFLADQLADWREMAADMVQSGAFDKQGGARNPYLVGGQMRAFDDLRRITLATIQGFYREASAAEADQNGESPRAD